MTARSSLDECFSRQLSNPTDKRQPIMNARLIALMTILCLSSGFQVVQAQEGACQDDPCRHHRARHVARPGFHEDLQHAGAGGDLAGIKVVAGYPGGTDFPPSRDRVKKFTEQLRGMGVEIVDSIPKLLEKVDVVLLESVDGRIHLQEALPVIKAGKPLFIDKPMAGSLVDAIAIYEAAKQHGVPFFSSSSSRFGPSFRELKQSQGARHACRRRRLGTVHLPGRNAGPVLLRHPWR